MAEYNYSDQIVDIHGREVQKFAGKDGRAACLLSDVKQTGFQIFQKTQLEQLSRIKLDDSDFGSDFIEHMVESAKAYMLANKIHFTDKIIMNSIESCKRTILADHKPESAKTPPPKNILLNDRQINMNVDDDIVIRVSNPSPQNQRITPQKRTSPNKTDEEKVTGFEKKSTDTGVKLRLPRQQGPVCDGEEAEPKLRSSCGGDVKGMRATVVVTAIDKATCVWGRDVASQGLLEQIFARTNHEARYQKVVKNPIAIDKLYMAKDNSSWYRCRVLKHKPLTVCFVDYGTMATVDEVREVSEELAKAPSVAVRITFKPSQYTPVLEDTISVQVILKNADGSYFVNVLQRVPANRNLKPLIQNLGKLSLNPEKGFRPLIEKSNKLNSKPEKGARSLDIQDSGKLNSKPEKHSDKSSLNPAREELVSGGLQRPGPKPEVREECPRFFERPPFLCQLEANQRVAIVALRDDVFYLRTKPCYEKLREIDEAIKKYVQRAPDLRRIEKNQLVLFRRSSDGRLCRGMVTVAEGGRFTVELLDHVETHQSDSLAHFKAISEELSREPMTYFCAGKLYGFEDKELGRRAREVVAGYIDAKKKFDVMLGFDNELDLQSGGQFLSDELQNLPEAPKKLVLKDMKPVRPDLGIQSYVCGCYENSNKLTIVPSEQLQQHVDYIIRKEVPDESAYEAEAGDVCLCFYMESWYRCVVIEDCEDMYKVCLLDFGNIELVRKKNVKRPDEKFTEVPTLAIPCDLTGLPQNPKVENLLKQKIIIGEVYNVDVKTFSGGKYHVEIPAVYKNIKDML